MLKLYELFRNQETFIISLFAILHILVLRVNNFLLQFLVDILPLSFGSMDSCNFADPNPGSKNLRYRIYPDPKHCLKS